MKNLIKELIQLDDDINIVQKILNETNDRIIDNLEQQIKSLEKDFELTMKDKTPVAWFVFRFHNANTEYVLYLFEDNKASESNIFETDDTEKYISLFSDPMVKSINVIRNLAYSNRALS